MNPVTRAVVLVGKVVLYPLFKVCESPDVCVDGVKCYVSRRWGQNEWQEYKRMIRSALSLIKLADPVRYRRVQKQISNILIYPLPVLAAWSRPGRMCLIDASRIAADENENVGFMKRIAAAIVGRATVGYISGRYRKGGRDVVARIWRLCDEEERRFLLRVRQWEKGLGVEHVGAGEMSMAEFDVETGE